MKKIFSNVYFLKYYVCFLKKIITNKILKINKLFIKYGGLQLDKEIRVLINYLTSLTSWSIREKFSRLTQIAILLGLEDLNELFEYWNSPLTITWRLTPNEIRQILLLRYYIKNMFKNIRTLFN